MHIIYLCYHYLLYCIYYATASCVHCCVLSLLPTGGCRLTVNSRLVRTYVCTKSYTWFTQSMAQMHSCASVHTTHSHTHVCVCCGISVAIFCTDYSYPMTALCSHLLSLYGCQSQQLSRLWLAVNSVGIPVHRPCQLLSLLGLQLLTCVFTCWVHWIVGKGSNVPQVVFCGCLTLR